MKLRRCFVPRQLLFLLAASGVSLGTSSAWSQETLTLRDGRTVQERIVGVDSSGIRVQRPAGSIVLPFSSVVKVLMAPPPEYTAAVAAYEMRDMPKALSVTQAVVKNYRGLPTDWAQSAMSMLGDIYVGMNRLGDAEAAYKDFQKAYPTAGQGPITVGMARIDASKKNFEAAKAKVDPILAEALKQRNPPGTGNGVYGQAFYVSGLVKEAAHDDQGALEDYLRTVTVFPQDRAAVASATEHAEALKAKGVTAP